MSRKETEPLVSGVPGNVHDSFQSRIQAERSYLLAYAMDCVRTLPPRNGTSLYTAVPAIPTPDAIMERFAQAPADYMGAEWHIVFQGRRPGVYPAW